MNLDRQSTDKVCAREARNESFLCHCLVSIQRSRLSKKIHNPFSWIGLSVCDVYFMMEMAIRRDVPFIFSVYPFPNVCGIIFRNIYTSGSHILVYAVLTTQRASHLFNLERRWDFLTLLIYAPDHSQIYVVTLHPKRLVWSNVCARGQCHS
jgi:hypothetical protein